MAVEMEIVSVELPKAAVAHARECAKLVNQPSLEAWILEWLLNSVKSVEKQTKQKEVSNVERNIEREVDDLYAEGTVKANTVLTRIPK